jgi:hypothetical protein
MIDPELAAQADKILGLQAERAARRRKRKRKPQPAQQAPPQVHVTVNVGTSSRPRTRGTAPGLPGDTIANDRSRIRRIAPSPG